MKDYPSIKKNPIFNEYYFFYPKLDGSNVRAEWNTKKGFYKFGKRNGLIDDSNPFLKEVPKIIMEKHSEKFNKILFDNKIKNAVCFFEFYGNNSFAGSHINEEHFCSLIDVSIENKGIILPSKLNQLFDQVDNFCPFLGEFKLSTEVYNDIINYNFSGMSFEGVVIKSDKYITPGIPESYKIKNILWKQKLKEYCGNNENLFKQLE